MLSISRFFDNQVSALGDLQHDISKHLVSSTPRMACELSDKVDSFIVTFEIPGVPKDMINVEVLHNVLSIEATKEERVKDENENRFFSERCYGKIARSINLPDTVLVDTAKICLENGVLCITFDKNPNAVAARKLEIA